MSDETRDFGDFVRQHSRQLQRAGLLLTADWGLAEDLVQVTLTTMWQRWNDVRHPEARGAYAQRVLMTTFLDRRRRRSAHEVATGDIPDGPSTASGADELADHTVVLAALMRLPPRQRAVVVLSYFNDLTETAAADALRCTVGTVKSQKSRALATLRNDLDLQALFGKDRS